MVIKHFKQMLWKYIKTVIVVFLQENSWLHYYYNVFLLPNGI